MRRAAFVGALLFASVATAETMGPIEAGLMPAELSFTAPTRKAEPDRLVGTSGLVAWFPWQHWGFEFVGGLNWWTADGFQPAGDAMDFVRRVQPSWWGFMGGVWRTSPGDQKWAQLLLHADLGFLETQRLVARSGPQLTYGPTGFMGGLSVGVALQLRLERYISLRFEVRAMGYLGPARTWGCTSSELGVLAEASGAGADLSTVPVGHGCNVAGVKASVGDDPVASPLVSAWAASRGQDVAFGGVVTAGVGLVMTPW